MPRKPPYRLYLIAAVLFLFMSGMMIQLFSVQHTDHIALASVRQGKYHLHIPLSSGFLYDRNMVPLNQSAPVTMAVVSPTPQTIASIFTRLRNPETVSAQIQKSTPFVCALTEDVPETPNIIILHGTEPLSGSRPAQHLLGYRQNGIPATGLEKAYGSFLTGCDSSADVTLTVSGVGELLAGAEREVTMNGRSGGGIVTTLDSNIQEIAEQALQHAAFSAGAAVVLNCKTGEILASASIPVYVPDALEDAMQQSDSPFWNRALAAYSVGSVFKLVIASAALENGITTGYHYPCSGSIDIYGQRFRCHKWDGHGMLDMENALIASCNPYFISLTQMLSADVLHNLAADMGFGQEIPLAEGIGSDSGVLQTTEELQIHAEKANFSFGQGKLLASPLQIAAMTACIANDGIYTQPRLITGATPDGQTLLRQTVSKQHRVLRSDTAETVCNMMVAVLEKSKGNPGNTTAGGKTSTAQTGQFDESGTEYCHAWMTGFFPAENPQYAVTVFGERAGSGNAMAAPVFREIIEHMAACAELMQVPDV